MEYKIGFTLEEVTLLRNSLDVIQIQGKNARMVAKLQDNFEEAAFQIQINLQMQEEKRAEEERKKMEELAALQKEEKPAPKPTRGRTAKK